QHGFTRTQINLMLAMVLSGLWHGASANFLVWGAVHGVGMVVLNCGDCVLGRDALSRRAPLLANVLTLMYVALAWVFFRSPTFEGSLEFLTALFTGFSVPLQFNSPVYLVLMWMVFRAYPWISRWPDLLVAGLHRLHWSTRPVVICALAWLGVSL